MNRLIVGNWKMNGLRSALSEVASLCDQLSTSQDEHAQTQVVICPPATLLAPLASQFSGRGIEWGGQDCHPKTSGAHTGDLSAPMFADLGAKFVILGHSERRADHGETDALVAAKAGSAIAAGLIPIICVGESEAQRDAGQAQDVVLGQIAGSLPADCDASQIVIAYEPVWAIGTGRVPSVEDVGAMHNAIRDVLTQRFGTNAGQDPKILYGGSVNPANAASLLSIDNVNGALVGGASLKAESFLAIICAK
jgi:triosephosphate isomerase (TIM)